MVYTFARVGAVMKVEDCHPRGRRLWVRLHEKGGKVNEMPCHHRLEQYLAEYVEAAGTAAGAKAPLFRSTLGRTGGFTE